MAPGFGFVAVEGAAEVADLGEAAHGGAGDVLGLAVAALAVVLDEEPAVGVFPGFFFILRQMAPGGAEQDRATEVTLGGGAVVVAVEQVTADLHLDLQALRVFLGPLPQELDGLPWP